MAEKASKSDKNTEVADAPVVDSQKVGQRNFA